MEIEHVPVMREEVMEALQLKRKGIYLDATLGMGGHAEAILQRVKECTLIGLDRDDEAIRISKARLSGFHNVHIVKGSFSDMKDAVNDLGFERISGILLDIGVSTLQLKDEGRGFSFLSDAPLDMRMDRKQRLTAERVVNSYKEKDLADIIWKYGEERYSRKIAKAVVHERRKKHIGTCRELADVIERVVWRKGRIHPATRTFQAIRIEVNRELEQLSAAIDSGAELLEKEGRLCVLSYHSLEDRIVKNAFRKLAKEGIFNIITRKPLVPSGREKDENPSSRSAKLRVAEKI